MSERRDEVREIINKYFENNPNYFYITVPYSDCEAVIDFDVKRIIKEGLGYLDSMAVVIQNNIPLEYHSIPIAIRTVIPSEVNNVGGLIFYFVGIPDQNPEIMIAKSDHPTIQAYDDYFKEDNQL